MVRGTGVERLRLITTRRPSATPSSTSAPGADVLEGVADGLRVVINRSRSTHVPLTIESGQSVLWTLGRIDNQSVCPQSAAVLGSYPLSPGAVGSNKALVET